MTKQNSFCAEVMLIIASIVHLGKSGLPQKAMTDDDYDRMMLCLQVVFIFIYLFIYFLILQYLIILMLMSLSGSGDVNLQHPYANCWDSSNVNLCRL